MVKILSLETPMGKLIDAVQYSDYATLEAENTRLRERIAVMDALRDFAHEATKALTNLTPGGSEYFSGKVDGIYLADIDRCVSVIRDRNLRIMNAARAARTNGGSDA